MRLKDIIPQFVEFMPKSPAPGILYISEKFRTASHLCCCGCGTKIVTPLRPTEYQMTRCGDLVSLRPSIGNWNHPCQSHYWITENRVVWAGRMSRAEIQRGRAHDDALKAAYFRKEAWWRKAAQRARGWLAKFLGKK